VDADEEPSNERLEPHTGSMASYPKPPEWPVLEDESLVDSCEPWSHFNLKNNPPKSAGFFDSPYPLEISPFEELQQSDSSPVALA
jgi:hypothetical protein